MATDKEREWLQSHEALAGLFEQVRGQDMATAASILAEWAREHNLTAETSGRTLTLDGIRVQLGDDPETALLEVSAFLGYC